MQFLFLVKQKDAINTQKKCIVGSVKQNRLLIFMKINPNGDKMECEICDGKGWYKVPNHRLEIMENIECMSCLSHQHFKDHLKEELTRLLVNTSPQKLAQIVAQLVVNSVDKNENDDIQRIEGIIHTKNVLNALTLAEAYSQ